MISALLPSCCCCHCAVAATMTQATGDPAYKAAVQSFVTNWLASAGRTSSNNNKDPQEEVVGIVYTPKGLAKAQPGGTLQHTASAAFLVLSAADSGVWDAKHLMRHACWVRNQIGYMLVSPCCLLCLWIVFGRGTGRSQAASGRRE